MLQVKNLQKTIGDKSILADLSFEIARGEVAVFLGGSGVGKSTLLRVLNGLESYEQGEFWLDGKELNLAHVSQNHTVGMVFQHFNLFEHLTVEENISLALTKTQRKSKEEAKALSSQWLNQYGLADKASSFPKSLSGGQKQRLAIARTLATSPEVVCLDEPTSALDPALTRQVAGYLSEIAGQNRIVCVSTHDTGLVEALEARLFLMQSGRVVQSCCTSEFFKSPDSYPLLQSFLKLAR